MPDTVEQSCSTGACGTGGWAGPLPGDPGSVFGLTATPAFGGVQLKWNLPGINPQAIAYVVIYRGYLPEFEHAIKLIEWSGSGYFDQTGLGEPLSVKYYWVQVMSVNGTLGDVIGPASATARPTISQFIELITGQIDNGVLAQSLRDKIDRITQLESSLADEVQDRLAGDGNLQGAISELNTLVGEVRTLVVDEISERVTEQGAIVQALMQLGGSSDGNLALLQQQLTTQVSRVDALVSDVTTLYTQVGNNTTAIIQEANLRNDAIGVSANTLANMVVNYHGEALGAIQTESLLRATEYGLIGQRIDAISIEWGNDIEAAISAYNLAEVQPFKAIAVSANQVEATVEGVVAQAKTELRVEIDQVSNQANAMGALWTAQVSFDGLIGGFGVFNNGAAVQAGFDVDTFWVGRTNSLTRKKPFIIQGDEVFIDKAVIGTVTADMLDTRGLVVRDGTGNPTLEIGETGDVVVTGTLRNGQTAWDTGTGFWMGKESGVPKMSFGSSTAGFTWNGSTFLVRGEIISTQNIAADLQVAFRSVSSANSPSLTTDTQTLASITFTPDFNGQILVSLSGWIAVESTIGTQYLMYDVTMDSISMSAQKIKFSTPNTGLTEGPASTMRSFTVTTGTPHTFRVLGFKSHATQAIADYDITMAILGVKK